jgi:hypothetical protein
MGWLWWKGAVEGLVCAGCFSQKNNLRRSNSRGGTIAFSASETQRCHRGSIISRLESQLSSQFYAVTSSHPVHPKQSGTIERVSFRKLTLS